MSKKTHLVIALEWSGFFSVKGALMKFKSDALNFSLINLTIEPEDFSKQVKSLKADGLIIENWKNETFTDVVADLKLKTIVIGASKRRRNCIQIGVDDAQSGKHAADYFVESRFKHFACAGTSCTSSHLQKESFFQRLKSRGFEDSQTCIEIQQLGSFEYFNDNNSALSGWLQALPKPIGLFVTSSSVGRSVCWIAKENQIAVPESISILASGEKHSVIDLSTPSLSTLPYPSEKIFETAISILRDWTKGTLPREKRILFAPKLIYSRESSKPVLIEDGKTQEALDWLRIHMSSPIDINQMCDTLGFKRKSVETAFKKYLNRTPREELEHLRIERAKHLLIYSDKSIPEISDCCGYQCSERLYDAFKRVTKVTPKAFQKMIKD